MNLKFIILIVGFLLVCAPNGLSQQPTQIETTASANKSSADKVADKVLERLIAMLNSKDPVVQLRAAEKLIEYGPDAIEAMELLAALTESPNEKLRQTAMIAFNQITSGRRIPRPVSPDSADLPDPQPEKPQKGKLAIVNAEEVNNQSSVKLKLDASKVKLEDDKPLTDGVFVVRVTSGTDTKESETKINAENNLPPSGQEIPVKLFAGKNKITIFPKINGKERREYSTEREITCNNCQDFTPGQTSNFRAILGLEQVGASSANSKQNPFFSLYFSTPIGIGGKKVCDGTDADCDACEAQNWKDCDKTKVKISDKSRFTFSVWGDLRFTTTPVQTFDALSGFNPLTFANSFLTTGNSGKVNDLVQTFDFLAGIEKEVFSPRELFGGVFPGKTSLSLIAAGGAISPLSSQKTAVFYKIPRVNNGMDIDPRFLEAFPEAAGKTNVAFISPDRDKFYRQYYAGVRLKTYFQSGERPLPYLPAMFDITFGQNEFITNNLRGVIMRLDGSTPLPIKKADFLYIFGGVQMKLGRTVNQKIPSFFLEPVTNATLTGSDTVVIPIDRSPYLLSNRDIYRLGVGVDLFKLFEKKEEKP